jgi:hypothetical protein
MFLHPSFAGARDFHIKKPCKLTNPVHDKIAPYLKGLKK